MSGSEVSYCVFIGSDFGLATSEARELENVYHFWHSRWQVKFQESGQPPSTWSRDFFQHDVITCLYHAGQPVGCHLYSFYDLTKDQAAAYFQCLRPGSVRRILGEFGPRTMTMEYLCATPHPPQLPLSLGATLIALGTRLAFERGCGSVLGMPIDGTSVSSKVKNLGMGAVCIEKGIQKYGYQLQLLATDPFRSMSNEPETAREYLNQLWDHKKTSYQKNLSATA